MFGWFDKKTDASALSKHAERAANKRIQSVDRWDAIQALARAGSPEAVEALLQRFTFYVDPSITDQEEKDAVFEAIVAVGAAARAPVSNFLRRTDSISWSVKILDRVADPDVVVSEVLSLLESMDIEYQRDPQKKIQCLTLLGERSDPRIAAVVARFLSDANETVRFHAVGALLAQAEREAQREALISALCSEESVRVKHRILEAFSAGAWDVGGRRGEVDSALPAGYALDAKGVPRRR